MLDSFSFDKVSHYLNPIYLRSGEHETWLIADEITTAAFDLLFPGS